MRKNFLLALLGMAAMFAGCSQEDNLANQSTDKVMSFTVGVDEGVNTRASAPSELPTRYIMEVYEATTSVGAAQATQVEQSANTFNVTLKDGKDYTILFWADYGTPQGSDNVFDASKLREVKIATGKVATKAAFAGVVQFKVGQGTIPTAVTLKHAVAQVKFSQTGALTATPSKLTVKYPESYSLNVEGYATATITGEVTHELACNAVTTGVIATDYIIASNADNALMTIEATLDSEAKKDISNAPFRRDYTTTISGAYSDKYSATLTVSCDAEWTEDNNEEIAPPVANLKVGDYYPAGATKATATGVVFWVNPDDATKGKIVSMDEPSSTLIWCTYAANGNLLIRSDTDGAENTAKVTNDRGYTDEIYPSIAWCVNKGEGWYMPALNELEALYTVWSADKEGFNAKLNTNIASDKYWASTEDNGSYQYYVDFNDGSNENDYKATTFHYVRAILAY